MKRIKRWLLLRLLEELRLEVRASNRPARESDVLDVMDMVSGWN